MKKQGFYLEETPEGFTRHEIYEPTRSLKMALADPHEPVFDGPRDKCIVLGCSNRRGEGGFIGDLCSPCYFILTTGKVNPTNGILKKLEKQSG